MRKLISFSEKQNEFFNEQARGKGVTFTEMIRRVLDKYIDDYEKEIIKKGEKKKNKL